MSEYDSQMTPEEAGRRFANGVMQALDEADPNRPPSPEAVKRISREKRKEMLFRVFLGISMILVVLAILQEKGEMSSWLSVGSFISVMIAECFRKKGTDVVRVVLFCAVIIANLWNLFMRR